MTDQEFDELFEKILKEQPEEFKDGVFFLNEIEIKKEHEQSKEYKELIEKALKENPEFFRREADEVPCGKPEHLRILLQGVDIWNRWRWDNPEITPELNFVDLTVKSIKKTKIWDTEIQRIYLKYAQLEKAHLCDAHLEKAYLKGANLKGADLGGAHLEKAYLKGANLVGAHLVGAHLEKAYLKYAQLEGAALQEANFEGANLEGINFEGAKLWGANFEGATLRGANFENAAVSDIKYKKEIKIGKMVLWRRNAIKSCNGIRVATCHGNPLFKRYAQDQDYLEHFKEDKPIWYWIWQITCNCGQSFSLWAFWLMLVAFLFGVVFAGSLPECFNWIPGIKHINGFLQDIKPELLIGEKVFRTNFTPYYFSIVTLTTLGFGDVIPKGLSGEIWITIEVALGYVMLGGLISIFANKVARRS